MSRGVLTVVFTGWLAIGLAAGGARGDELDSRLGLADLAGYHEALQGKATARDVAAAEPVRPVSFRDLWDHPDVWKGHRVQIRGKLVRIFRQDAVGGFPPLVEAWLSTARGDLFCTVFPTGRVPDLGREAAFTGTFLRTIRYAGTDQPRLAPCVVGDRPPELLAAASQPAPAAAPGEGWNRPVASWSRAGYVVVLALALAGALLLAWANRNPAFPDRKSKIENAQSEPSLVFLEPEPLNGSAITHTRPH